MSQIFVRPLQVENATYVWLPLLPRTDGAGYELQFENEWRPADFRDRARVPVVYNTGTAPAPAAAAETTGGARVQGGGAAATTPSGPTGAAAKRTPTQPPAGIEAFTRPSIFALSSTAASRAAAPSMTTAAGGSFVRRAANRVEAWLTG